MRILVAGDEPSALELLTNTIKEAAGDAQVDSFTNPAELIEFADTTTCDIAFVDIDMAAMSGIKLAKELKEMFPNINIIFLARHDKCAGAAMAIHASGYILKPVTAKKVSTELADLRYPITAKKDTLLQIRCFGNFDVYTPEGALVHFKRSKSKELLAYLIYRSGASSSIKEIAVVLFEDGQYDKKQLGYVQKIISSLMQTLKEIGAENIVIKKYNSMAIDINLVDCDYYRFARLDDSAVNSYAGEFMSQYSWAEFAIGYLEKIFSGKDLA